MLYLSDSHTGEYPCAIYVEMFEEWHIKRQQLHFILCDNVASMAKAMRDCSFSDLAYLLMPFNL